MGFSASDYKEWEIKVLKDIKVKYSVACLLTICTKSSKSFTQLTKHKKVETSGRRSGLSVFKRRVLI